MRKKSFAYFLVGILIIFGVIIWNSITKYNAKMYSNANEWINDNFLDNNKVRGAFYKNEEYPGNGDDVVDEYYCDQESPRNRTYIINDQNTFNEIFKKNSLDVDFEKDMVLLYIFADVYPNRDYHIKHIIKDGECLTVKYKVENNSKKDGTAPFQRCMVVKLKKINISTVEFISEN